jgi:hypothetical protein
VSLIYFAMIMSYNEDVAGKGTSLGGEEDAVANITRQIEDEISAYKTLRALPSFDSANTFADPLPWWKQKQIQFPILACLARKYLCIPATDAPSAQISSTASLILGKFRERVDPDLAGRMVFIKKNFEWYEELRLKWYVIEMVTVGTIEVQVMGEYLCVKELSRNNQRVEGS